jgi:hypothetical protein
MSLTRQASTERMWGSFPALRVILEEKKVPDQDNIFGQLSRLLQLTILIRENKAQITEALRANRAHKPVSEDDFCRIGQLENDLSRLRSGYRWASKIFQDAAKELDEEIGEERGAGETKSLLRSLALQLAWYIDKHGYIPDSEVVKLFGIGHGLDSSENAQTLRNLVAEILKDVPEV